MLERILLAAITTVCIYLFLNFGGNSSNTSSVDAQKNLIPGFVSRVTLAW